MSPIYVFQCPDCGNAMEIIRRIEDRDNPAACRQCFVAMERIEVVPTARPKIFNPTEGWNPNRPWDTITDVPPEDTSHYTKLGPNHTDE